MARILEIKGLKIDLDNATEEEKAKLQELNPKLYGVIFEGKPREKRKPEKENPEAPEAPEVEEPPKPKKTKKSKEAI